MSCVPHGRKGKLKCKVTPPERGACRAPGGRCTKAKHCCDRKCTKKDRICALPTDRRGRSAFFEVGADADADEVDADDDEYDGDDDAGSGGVRVHAVDEGAPHAHGQRRDTHAEDSTGLFVAGFLSASLLAVIITTYRSSMRKRTHGKVGNGHGRGGSLAGVKGVGQASATKPDTHASKVRASTFFVESDAEDEDAVVARGHDGAIANDGLPPRYNGAAPKKKPSSVALVIEQVPGFNFKSLRQRSRETLLGRRWHTATT